MIKKNDWRLQGQERFLLDETLYYRQWKEYKQNWDHDHCEFCMTKFSESQNTFHKGYTTKDNSRWICPDCFNDFRDLFHWTLGDEISEK